MVVRGEFGEMTRRRAEFPAGIPVYRCPANFVRDDVAHGQPGAIQDLFERCGIQIDLMERCSAGVERLADRFLRTAGGERGDEKQGRGCDQDFYYCFVH